MHLLPLFDESALLRLFFAFDRLHFSFVIVPSFCGCSTMSKLFFFCTAFVESVCLRLILLQRPFFALSDLINTKRSRSLDLGGLFIRTHTFPY